MRSNGLEVITRDRYIERMREYAIAMSKDQTINAQPLNRWAERSLARLESQGRLVSEQQYQDWRRKRILRVGDRAQYVGPDREEQTDEGVNKRSHGQPGAITEVKRKGGEYLIRFRPDDGSADLVVLTNTRGYFTLERIPQGNRASA